MQRSPADVPTPGWQVSPDGRRFFDPTSGWEPLTLTAHGVRRVVADQFSLTATDVALLSGGYLNQTWRVAAGGTDWVVRVSRPGRTVEQVTWEQRAARIWHGTVPQVVVAEAIGVADATTGSPRPVTLFRYCPSDPVIDSTTRDRHLIMAQLMAGLHRAALAEPLPQRPGLRSIDDDVTDLFGWQHIRAEVVAQTASDPRVTSAAERIDAALVDVEARLDRLRGDGVLEVRAQAWNDLNPRNRLYRGDQLVGLVDTDDACVQPLAWEVGKELYGHPHVPPEEFLAAYRRAGGPVGGDMASLSMFGQLGDLTALLWMTEYGDGVTVTDDAPAKLVDLAGSL